MTHLLASLRASLYQLVRQTFCGHPTRTSVPVAVHPPDGRTIFGCHCPTCDARWKEYG